MGFSALREGKMNQQLNIQSPVGPRRKPFLDPVALTALLYLKEALLEERYEDCDEILSVAREFGAPALKIAWLLEDPRRRLFA